MKHLSDEELQLYLSGKSEEGTEFIEEHLQNCAECRRQLRLYKSIDSALAVRQEEGFAENFDTMVMNGIRESAKKPQPLTDFVVVGLAFAGIVGIFLLFILSGAFRELFVQGLNQVVESAKTYTASSGKYSEWLKLAPAALIIIFCYGILDRLLVQGKKFGSNYLLL